MPQKYIGAIASSNKPLRASKLREINDQADVLYTPGQFQSPAQGLYIGSTFFTTLLTTGSTTYVDIPSFTVLANSVGRRLSVFAQIWCLPGVSSVFEFVTVIDGTVQTNSERAITGHATAQGNYLETYHFITPVQQAGQHTVKLQVKRLIGANTIAIYAAQDARLRVRDY